MAKINEKELQAKLDVEKWLASEQAGHDVCGEFDYCANCDKTLENPCAKASLTVKPVKAPAAKPLSETKVVAEKKPAAKKPAAKKPAAKK